MEYRTTVDGIGPVVLDVDFPDWKDTAKLRGRYEALGYAYNATEIVKRAKAQAEAIEAAPEDDPRRGWSPAERDADLALHECPPEDFEVLHEWRDFPASVGATYTASVTTEDGKAVEAWEKGGTFRVALTVVGMAILRGEPGALCEAADGD